MGSSPVARFARLTHRGHRSLQDILRALLALILPIDAAPQGPHPILRHPPRLQGETAVTARSCRRIAAAAAAASLFREVSDEGCERGHAGDEDAHVGLDNGPLDGFGGIEVVGEAGDCLDADDLDNGDEDAQGEEA